MTGKSLSGLKDKLYWRQVPIGRGQFHAFEKVLTQLVGKTRLRYLIHFESLCGKHHIPKAYGQGIERPKALLRCGRCDGLEMEMRGWTESGPATR